MKNFKILTLILVILFIIISFLFADVDKDSIVKIDGPLIIIDDISPAILLENINLLYNNQENFAIWNKKGKFEIIKFKKYKNLETLFTIDWKTKNIGIKTSNPSKELDVNGIIYARNGIKRGEKGIILKEEILDIGNWNMHYSRDGIPNFSVNHEMIHSKIRVVNIIIKNDTGTQQLNFLSSNNGQFSYGTGAIIINVTNITMAQDQNSSLFDSTAYDNQENTQNNRGWIYILYEI